MGTTAQKLQAILDSKTDIKDAIEQKGVTVGTTPLSGYAQKILDIPTGGDTDGMNGFLSVESKTIPTSPSQTINIAYNPKCGIMDENNELWDVLEWHQRWVNNGYSAEGLSKPTGIWMEAFGMELKYLWPIEDAVGYSDVTGTIAVRKNTFPFYIYDQQFILTATAADRTVWPANQSGNISHGTAGKYRSATWRSRLNGDGLDLVCDNTGETFTIPNRETKPIERYFFGENHEDYMEMYYERCEFLRAMFAICSGITTTQSDGTVGQVDILNSAGQQAAIGEDMYFWIGGQNTGLLAKYNLNCLVRSDRDVTTGSLTQTIADAIYDKQKANGVNMNDTGVNSSTKPVRVAGMKGAEAVAVDGYWYIKTPFIGFPNKTAFTESRNTPDDPLVYVCRHHGVVIATGRMYYPYYLNKFTLVTAIVNLLRNTEGMNSDIPDIINTSIFTVIPFNQAYVQVVSMFEGGLAKTNPQSNNRILPLPLSSTIYTKHQSQ